MRTASASLSGSASKPGAIQGDEPRRERKGEREQDELGGSSSVKICWKNAWLPVALWS